MAEKKMSLNFSGNSFITNNLVFLSGTIAVAGLNYLFFPVIGRLISVDEFGELQSFLGLFSIFGVVLTGFGLAVALIKQRADHNYLARFLYLENLSIIGLFFLFLPVFAFQIFQQRELHNSLIPLLLIGTLVLINVPSTSRTFLLQSEEKYWVVTFSAILFSVSKLLFSVLATILDKPVTGILVAFLSAQLLTLIFLSRKTSTQVPSWFASVVKQIRIFRKEEKELFRYKADATTFIFATTTLFFYTLLLSGDVIIAQILLPPNYAGIYSGISGISKIVFFVSASFAGVIFVETIKKQPRSVLARKINLSFIFAVIASGTLGLIFSVNPSLSVSILIGSKYLEGSHLVPVFAYFMFIMAISSLSINLIIGLKVYWGLLGPLLGVFSVYILLNILSSEMLSIVISFSVGATISLIIMIATISLNLQRGTNAYFDSDTLP